MRKMVCYLGVCTAMGVVILFFVHDEAFSAPFTIQWSADVESRTGTLAQGLLAVGETLSFSGVFDNGSTQMHSYSPGGDIVYNTADYTGMDDVFDDVTYNFSSNLQALIDGTDKTYVDIDLSWYIHDILVNGHYSQYRDPGIEIVFFGDSGGGVNWGYVNYAIAGEVFQVNVTNVNCSIEPGPPAPVPEPITLCLFGTGLAGLAGSRSIRKNHQL